MSGIALSSFEFLLFTIELDSFVVLFSRRPRPHYGNDLYEEEKQEKKKKRKKRLLTRNVFSNLHIHIQYGCVNSEVLKQYITSYG